MPEYSLTTFGRLYQRQHPDKIFVIKWSVHEPPSFLLYEQPQALWRQLLTNPDYKDLALVPPGQSPEDTPRPNLSFDDETATFSILYGCSESVDHYRVFSRYDEVRDILDA